MVFSSLHNNSKVKLTGIVLGWVPLQRELNNLGQWPQGSTSSYQIAHEKENPTLRNTYSYENRISHGDIRAPTRSAREKKQSLRREIRIHRKSAREGKPYAEERRENLTALVAWFL